MGFEILVVWAGRHARDRWQELCADYRARIARWVPVRDLGPVRCRATGEGAERRRAEGAALAAALPDDAFLVALDARGDAPTSEELAGWLERQRREWPRPLAFVLGSDVGLDPELLSRARRVLSFGPLTLGHELARLVLYEQLYRSLSIAAGMHYHRPTAAETPPENTRWRRRR
jgi:23S rRNA (pseudouridine1915-N3)-methyltransferase